MLLRTLAGIGTLGFLLACGGAPPAQVADSADQRRASSSDYARTRYPIVLVHGMSGFRTLLGALDYWYGIPESLRRSGATVFVTQASAFNSPAERGEQVLRQVESIVARTGAQKVNLIGHSQGGLDVRYVASVRPDLVASVTTVGTPHQGASLADFLRAHLSHGGFDEQAVAALGNSFGFLLGLLEGRPTLPQDSKAGLDSLTSKGTAAFNAIHPAGLPGRHCGDGPASQDGIHYFSWSGTSQVTNLLDWTDYGLLTASVVYPDENDGLVGRCSSHFGKVIRDDYDLNHLDEVNQVLGLTALFGTDPVSLFRAHANRLRHLGL